jgi:hypothetical protein
MSLIAWWWTQRDQGVLAALAKPAGRPQADPKDREIAKRQFDGRERAHVMIDDAIVELAPVVGVREACAAVGRPQANHYRRHRQSPVPARE